MEHMPAKKTDKPARPLPWPGFIAACLFLAFITYRIGAAGPLIPILLDAGYAEATVTAAFESPHTRRGGKEFNAIYEYTDGMYDCHVSDHPWLINIMRTKGEKVRVAYKRSDPTQCIPTDTIWQNLVLLLFFLLMMTMARLGIWISRPIGLFRKSPPQDESPASALQK